MENLLTQSCPTTPRSHSSSLPISHLSLGALISMDDDLLDVARSGLREIWNVRLTKAEEIFSAHIDTNVVFCLLHAQCAWVKGAITESPEDCREAFCRISQTLKMAKAWKKASHWKGKSEPEALEGMLWGKIATAEGLLFEATLKFKTQKRIKGAFNLRKSWKAYESCVSFLKKLDQDRPMYKILAGSVDFGVGLFHYMISVIPKAFLWLVEGIGFKGDRMLALSELESSCLSGGIRANTAKLLLIALHSFFFGNEEAAMEVFEDVMIDFPDSPIFQYFGGYLYRKQGELDQAFKLFTGAVENGVELPQFQLFARYELGYVHYLRLEWIPAIEYFEGFLKETKSEGFKAFCNYQLATAYAMQFHEDKAMEHWKESLKWVRKGYSYDEYAKRHAKYHISKGAIDDFDRKLIQASLMHESRKFKKALKRLKQCEPFIETDGQRLVVAYFKGDCNKELDRNEKARAHFQEVLDFDGKLPNAAVFAKATSYVCMGEIALLDRDYDGAEDYYKKASKYSNFDFESWCNVRIQRGNDIIQMVRRKENRKGQEE